MIRNMIPPILSIIVYAITLAISLRLLAHDLENGVVRIAISLAPMVPAVFLCWSIVRAIGCLDEMQRKLQLEAFALAFAGTALITFSYGFLENVGFPKLSLFVVWPLMCTLWIAGLVIGRLRYR
ncbi:hypothetical protein C5748_20525 [Phyllobacterium phragmitis]|uniref:Uncharacterized protein n=2 Tax=Phyllobacterium phragmitis TaxID=2670329 RepID=A0A2S9IMG0_9HYPH|nr:hypothetical protein C5748_20525 [Phyllobacterium phragmitis]